ncbi:MAG: sugar phosphate isomerase/epimerase [Lentisphaeria bacterium]|nr:sugar phosphate isomerase/epimerase [Lentisphaeria bacterium]
MFQVPITYLVDICDDERVRRQLFQEFAACGAKHLNVSDQLLRIALAHPAFAAQVTREIAAEGMSWVDSHAMASTLEDPVWDLNCLDPKYFKQIVAHRKTELQIVADMGVKTMTIHLGNSVAPYDTPESIQRQEENILRCLEELVPYAESCGVTIGIENIWFKINTPEMLLKFCRWIDSPYLGCCFDSGHANLAAKGKGLQIANDPDVLEKMLPWIINCHIHDNDGLSDQHLAPGEGNVDWAHVTGLLANAPRLKCIQCETIAKYTSIQAMCSGMQKFFGSTC